MQILKQLPFLQNTSADIFRRLLQRGELVKYKKGEVMWQPPTGAPHLPFSPLLHPPAPQPLHPPRPCFLPLYLSLATPLDLPLPFHLSHYPLPCPRPFILPHHLLYPSPMLVCFSLFTPSVSTIAFTCMKLQANNSILKALFTPVWTVLYLPAAASP